MAAAAQARPERVIAEIHLPEPHALQEQIVDWEILHPEAQVGVFPAGTKSGKALCLDTPIPTPKGWVTMGDLKAGDVVFDEFGRPVRVVYATETRYDRPCFEVVFSDGAKIVADAEHLWETTTHCERKNQARGLYAPARVRTTAEIAATAIWTVAGVTRPNHAIPLVAGPVGFKTKAHLPIDPYLLGVWLGNGTAITGNITMNSADGDVIERIRASGWGVHSVPSSVYTWRVEGLTKALRKAGLLGVKRIPTEYLTASSDDRLALLQGLMDTDGTIGRTGRASFDNTEIDLVDGAESLAVSFGIKTSRRQRIGKINGEEFKICYQVNFTTDTEVFSSRRKKARLRPVAAKARLRYIMSVKPIPSVPVRCIRVDSPTHLFLAGRHCVPTHNSFGFSMWQVSKNLSIPGQFGVWSAPTLYKARVGYRYQKAMLPDIPEIDCKDGKQEIWFGNGSFTKFLHGHDAETTMEGEAVDNFVIDEAGKQKKQLWYSTFTTITQTMGKGIIGGTPRGTGHWFYDVWRQACAGDPFFCQAVLRTIDSPFVNPKAVENARRLLPRYLYEQYYLALFTSQSSVYGDLDAMWDRSLEVKRPNFWVHPDESARLRPATLGYDPGKRRDPAVFFVINDLGMTVGYCRMRQREYTEQIGLLTRFARCFKGEDNEIRYDRTGVGDAIGEEIGKAFDVSWLGNWTVTPVVFTNAIKQEMVSRIHIALEQGWFRSPYIPRLEHELISLEVSTSRTGLHTYSAPEGDHDDVHWAVGLALSGAHASLVQDDALEMIDAAMSGKLLTSLEDEDPPEEDDPLGDELESIMAGEDEENGADALEEEIE